jgi:hypothetical protein
MTVEVDVGGRRYVEDRDTAAVVRGEKETAVTFRERWSLVLDGATETAWRLTNLDTAASRPSPS